MVPLASRDNVHLIRSWTLARSCRAGPNLTSQTANAVGGHQLTLTNGWGLFEMHGNVFEWCADHWHDSYDGAPANGSAWMAARGAAPRVVRGGSWYDGARDVRAASATAAPRRTAVAASAFAAPEFR